MSDVESTVSPDTHENSESPVIKHVKPVIPEGMSKKQWKREQKRLKFLERKDEFVALRKEKKKKARANKKLKIREYVERGEEIPVELLSKRNQKPIDQIQTNCKIIIDCDFDDLMVPKDRISLSSQIARAYSSNKKSPYACDLEVSSFNKLLKQRFDESIKDSKFWKSISFNEDHFNTEDTSKMIYLSADSKEVLSELKEDWTYVIGGIVDKGHHKNLCLNKAEKLGIKTARLPIDEYIRLDGRKVLTTTHVVDLLLKWWQYKDWKKAFGEALPPRKLLEEREEVKTDEQKDEKEEVTEVEQVEEEQQQ